MKPFSLQKLIQKLRSLLESERQRLCSSNADASDTLPYAIADDPVSADAKIIESVRLGNIERSKGVRLGGCTTGVDPT